MTENIENYQELSGENRIKKLFSEMIKFFQDLPEDKLSTVTPLVQNACFIRVTLDRLQKEINENALTEDYQNGSAQSGKKITSQLQIYNSLIRNYTVIISKLLKVIPEKEEKTDSKLSFFLDDLDEMEV